MNRGSSCTEWRSRAHFRLDTLETAILAGCVCAAAAPLYRGGVERGAGSVGSEACILNTDVQ